MFPKIREVINNAELEQLAEELDTAKHKRLRKAS
jgi:hypothetical protein